MATPAQAFDTYESVGNREQLADIISNIAPWETPVLSALSTGSEKGTYFEWQTDDLADAADNAVIEGEDATIQACSPTKRVGNYMQISTKTLQITGTEEVIEKAGRASEMAYQKAKKGKELKKDMEFILTGKHQAKDAGSTSAARKLGNFSSWITTNVDMGSASKPKGDGTDIGTDPTARVFTEAMLQGGMQKAWAEGGNPDTLFVSPDIKKLISTSFKGRATTTYDEASDRTAQAVVDMYVTDFGTIKVVPSRIMKSDMALLLDTSMASVQYLRPLFSFPLAKTGDSEKEQMLVEWSLKVNNEKAHAAFRGIKAA